MLARAVSVGSGRGLPQATRLGDGPGLSTGVVWYLSSLTARQVSGLVASSGCAALIPLA